MGIMPLDSGLWFGKWRLDEGRATLGHLGECQMRLLSLLSSVTSAKNIQVAQALISWLCRSNTILFRAHRKKLQGTLV